MVLGFAYGKGGDFEAVSQARNGSSSKHNDDD